MSTRPIVPCLWFDDQAEQAAAFYAKDQEEVDRYWSALSEGGQPGPCGWLQDRFGLSWQVVPSGITAWMTSRDAAARDRAFMAMMGMGKPDVATLQAAFDGV